MTLAQSRVAVTGTRGRLGSALMSGLGSSNVVAWSRPQYDLDRADMADALLERDRPSLVIHCAAWTDVDGCARAPELAMRRNADAVGELARSCAQRGVGMVLISTNEVFDGDRTDGHGYVESDEPHPINPYGASKLAGEQAASDAFGGSDGLWIVRTAWLYGPPGNDFPSKIVAAADRLLPDESLPVVADETGSPTYAPDLAEALVRLVGMTPGGLFHLVNEGHASRRDWAVRVLQRCRPGRAVRDISRVQFERPSHAPAWAALDAERAARSTGARLRSWTEAVDAYVSGWE